MPDWAQEVRERLSSLRRSPTREADFVEELACDIAPLRLAHQAPSGFTASLRTTLSHWH